MPLDRPPDPARCTRPSLAPIPPALREQVLQMNEVYLDVLSSAGTGAACEADRTGLAESVIAGLVALPPAARERIARCPVSLFNLRFEDTAFWTGIGGATVAETDISHYAATAPRPFVDTALFFAWHVVQCSEFAARLLLAMPIATHRIFHQLPLARLHRLAASCPDLLQPRWADHPCFWPDLIGAAQRADPAALDAALLAGVQLVFKEVEPGAVCPQTAGPATTRHRRQR